MSKSTKRITHQKCWSWKSDFYDFWDAFVRNWFETRSNKTDKLELVFSFLGGLYLDALPEPYLGSHKNAKVVIINYNPGLSDAGDSCKFFSRRKVKVVGGEKNLMRFLQDKCSKSYKKFARRWNPLASKTDIPGSSWWTERFKWIKQIHGILSNQNGENDPIGRDEVFCLEFCPYHSKSFKMELSFGKADASENRTLLKEHILKRVLIPAINVVVKNNLPCIICVGSKIGQYFVDEYEAITFVEKWDGKKYEWHDNKWQETGECRRWPIGKACRSYELLSVDLGHSMWEGVFDRAATRKSIPILVTYTKGSNNVPSEKFLKIEAAFVKQGFKKLKQRNQQKGKRK